MIKQVKARFSALLAWPDDRGRRVRRDRRARAGKSERFSGLSCETLEGRVVLSGWGGDLFDGLSGVGIVPSVNLNIPSNPWGGSDSFRSNPGSPFAQLNIDLGKFQTDLQTLAAKSEVTFTDLNNLNSDSQAIAQAGFQFDSENLHTVTFQLASAVVSGGDTAQAQSDFAAQFSGSNVSPSVVAKTTSDVVQTIKASNVTSSDLSTIATDQQAIETDLGSLPDGVNDLNLSSQLLSSLASLGINTNAKAASVPVNPTTGSVASPDARVAQLNTDLQKLETDSLGLLAKSEVTPTDLNNLNVDSQAIAKAGHVPNIQGLPPVVLETAKAVASGAATTQAQADFNALFGGSSVPTSVIDKAFDDLIQTIEDSKVTSSNLSTIAADQQAIETDVANQHTKPNENMLPPFITITGSAAGLGNSLSNSGTGNTTGNANTGDAGAPSPRVGSWTRGRTMFRSRQR